MTDVLIDGCLFEGSYANRKGGGISQQHGDMSVVGSVFYGNVAGGNNIENGESRAEATFSKYGDRGSHGDG